MGLAASGEHTQSYFSYANTYSNGIIPTNNLNRHNISLRLGSDFGNKFLVLDGSALYIKQYILNRANPGFFFFKSSLGSLSNAKIF